MTQIVTQLRSSIDNEEARLEKDLTSGIQKVVGDTTAAYQVVFSDIISALQTSGEIVSGDLTKIETGLATVISTMESTAESVYATFTNNIEEAMTKLKGIAGDAITGVSDATSYLRNGAYQEFDAAIAKARSDFDGFKTRFTDTIAALGQTIISKTKAAVDSIVSSAQSDIDRLKTMKNTIESDVGTVLSDIRADLEKVKAKATADMERIVSFIENGLDKLEKRVEGMAAKVNRLGTIIAGVSIAVAAAAGVYLIVDARRTVKNVGPYQQPSVPKEELGQQLGPRTSQSMTGGARASHV